MLTPTSGHAHQWFGRTGAESRPIPRVSVRQSPLGAVDCSVRRCCGRCRSETRCAKSAANRPTISESANVSTTLRLGLAMHLCVALSGCAMLPVAALNLAAQGAQGLVALSLGPLSDMQERSAKDRCRVATAKGFSVTETLERATPTGEGKISIYELVLWRPEFAIEGYPQVEQSRTSIEGSLNITERSVSFVPPPGTTSVRIPYELVQDVEVSRKRRCWRASFHDREILLWALRHRQFPAS